MPEAAKILLVDDSATNRLLLEAETTRLGYLAVLAANGAAALAEVQKQPPELILLDIIMPEMDGYEVLERLKADPATRDIPVIVISAIDELDSVVRCIQRGAEDYLPKPFNATLLQARIGACLEKKALRDQEKRKTEELERTLKKLQTTQAQLVMQEKLASLGALTAGIAHEIKNPLNFVNNFSQVSVGLLSDLREGLEKQQGVLDAAAYEDMTSLVTDLEQNLSRISEHGRRADGIVRGMLQHSQGGTGQRQPADLNALAAEFVRLAYHSMQAQDASLDVKFEEAYDPAAGTIQAVPQDLRRVILNLAGNAIYAAQAKKKAVNGAFVPTVTVQTRAADDRVELRIRDNGDGVPAAIRDKIFLPFFTTKPTGTGTGLGLSISHDIVVQGHQGEIRVETEEGKYAEFIVSLPRTS